MGRHDMPHTFGHWAATEEMSFHSHCHHGNGPLVNFNMNLRKSRSACLDKYLVCCKQPPAKSLLQQTRTGYRGLMQHNDPHVLPIIAVYATPPLQVTAPLPLPMRPPKPVHPAREVTPRPRQQQRHIPRHPGTVSCRPGIVRNAFSSTSC